MGSRRPSTNGKPVRDDPQTRMRALLARQIDVDNPLCQADVTLLPNALIRPFLRVGAQR
jgi:hypothetical protein